MSTVVTKNIFWLTVSRVLALVLLFVAYQQLFRYLGPEGTGKYQFVLSYVLLFTAVIDFGVQQFITKKISEEPSETKNYFQKFLAFETFIASVIYILLIAIAWIRGYEPVVFAAVAVTGLGLVANALTYPFLSVMTAFQDLKKVAFINFLNSVVNISIILLAVWLKKYIVFLASIQLIFGILDLVLYRIFIRKHIPQPDVLHSFSHLDFGLIRSILSVAWPFVLLVGFSSVYNRIDVLIITNMLGFEENGYYSAAYKFFDLLSFFPATVSHTLLPFFSGLIATGALVAVRGTLEKYLRLMLAVALPMAVGGMVLARPLVALVNGPEFVERTPEVLAILIWAIAMLFIYIPVNALVISQLTKKAAVVTGVNVVINIVGNVLLIPVLGIKAAAIMTLVSEMLQGVFYFYFARKSIGAFAIFSLVYRPAVASLIMGLVLWSIRDMSLLISLLSGATVYAAVLLLTGFFSREDLVMVKSLVKPANA